MLRMADAEDLLAPIHTPNHVRAKLDVIFHDAGERHSVVRPPDADDARAILNFFRACTAPHFVAQCQNGIGRSVAVLAALSKNHGSESDAMALIAGGTYNRRLYRLLLAAAGLPVPAEPLVSMVVRVKYPVDRLRAFILSMQRQRHENWECIVVTDGPNPGVRSELDQAGNPKVRLIETPKALGRWGHPYRQLGIDAARGEFIGLSNDDNYYVPGYFEQMIGAMQAENADLAACAMLHNYFRWDFNGIYGYDVGAWLGRAELVKRVKWPTHGEFDSDNEYFDMLCKAARRVEIVKRALFVHN